ncbi:hypothetical protein ACH5RR_024107 [Cinchona calisaya]|uniref:NTF2-like domain-containing protein n=1 Tax=Cinchona calisaya TaxID=153742 RepID=A0ABD2ZCJ6_9GENT
MATLFSSNLCTHHHQVNFHPSYRSVDSQKTFKLRCSVKNTTDTSSSTSTQESEPENLLLKMAWYGSELLGIAASFVRSPKNVGIPQVKSELVVYESGLTDRNTIATTIQDDFRRSYFVTGNLTPDAYEEDCEFADPASSFRGLRRFKRNCTNFGSLLEKSNMKLMKWEEFEDKAIGHWRFSCTLSFPWKPILSATGYTEYYFNKKSGKVCRHVEHWNVPKMALLKQILRPSRGFWHKRDSSAVLYQLTKLLAGSSISLGAISPRIIWTA